VSRLDAALRGLRGRFRPSPAPQGRAQGTGDLIAPSGMLPADLANETLAGLFARPGRMSLTVLGTVIGLAALVATLGLSRTAGNRIVGHFDELAATQVVVSRSTTASPDASALPWDAPARLERLNGVVAAGNMSTVNIGKQQVSTSPISDPTRQTDLKLTVQAASPGLFTAVRAQLRGGRLLDEGNSLRAERVAVLGPSAAQKLGISGVEQLPAIRIGDDLYLVVGIIDSVARQPALLGAVIVPEGTARRDFGLTSPEVVVVETKIGAAKLISQQAALALRPDSTRGLKVASPPEPQRARDRVQSDLSLLFLMLGGVSLLVGAIGIANVTLVSVIERTGEIGLRRALGATRRHIAMQFLLESGTMGLVGGVLGASIGTLVVVGVSAYQDWTPVLDPLVPFAAPLLGAIVGLVSGTYPALRAARLEPVEALRTGT
jgi:macrolide transport system ATP-binding/permease protein